MKSLETKHNLMLIGTDDRKELIENIAEYLSEILDEKPVVEIIEYDEFLNEETKFKNSESMRGKHVYVIMDLYNKIKNSAGITPKVNDKLMYSWLQLYNAKDHGAKTINALYTSFPYSRADQKEAEGNDARSKRSPISLGFVLNTLENIGVDQLITLDMHNRSSVTGLDKSHTKFTDLPTGWFIEKAIDQIGISKDLISMRAADAGGAKKIPGIAQGHGLKYGFNAKIKDTSKDQENAIDESYVVGKAEGRYILLHDDIGDTMGTIDKAARQLHEKNPLGISVAITIPLLNGPALDRLDKLHEEKIIEYVFVTNSVKHENLRPYIKTVDNSLFFADKIASIAKGESMDYNRNHLVTNIKDD